MEYYCQQRRKGTALYMQGDISWGPKTRSGEWSEADIHIIYTEYLTIKRKTEFSVHSDSSYGVIEVQVNGQ